MMRITFAFLLIAAVVSLPVHARSDVTKFKGVQEHCVQVGDIKFGANGRWSSCEVTKGRWFATLGILDLYQVQYCLGKPGGACDRRAFLVFANRAYAPNAKLILQRIDPGAAEYDDPLLIKTKYGDILTLSASFPGGNVAKSYYRWRSGRWMPIDTRGWLRDLSKRLPKGASIATAEVWPDVDTMSARANLYRAGSATGEVAEIELALTEERFAVTQVKLVPQVP